MATFSLEALAQAAVFTGARVSGLMIYCPFLGSDAIPAPLKAALTVVITALLWPLRTGSQMSLNAWQWVGAGLGEAIIGLALGLAANYLMEGALLAGQILGIQMGYSLATLFDPQTQADTPVLAEFHRLAALLIFLQMNIHHWLLRAVAASFAYLPAGSALTLAAAGGLWNAAGGIFLAGLQLAAPALAATLVADAALGFLAKASPQLPVMFIGLAVKNLAGMAVLLIVIRYWPHSFTEGFTRSIALAERLLRLGH